MKFKLALAIIALILLFIGIFRYFAQAQGSTNEWWNVTWHYRVKLEINSTSYSRTDWPIEYKINFTSLLESLGVSGTFDENSIRVFERLFFS